MSRWAGERDVGGSRIHFTAIQTPDWLD